MTLSTGQVPPGAAAAAHPSTGKANASKHRHRRLVEAVQDELLSWNHREFILAFRRWHQDSSLIHLNVLTLLEQDGSASMSQLARGLDVSVASMTGIADRMEKRGLVERGKDPVDRRIVVVRATEVGLDVFREIDRRRREGLAKLLAQLDDDDLEGLLAGHRALHDARARALAAAGQVLPSGLHPISTSGTHDRPVKPTRRSRA